MQMQNLQTKGYAIIPNVLTSKEVEENLALFRKWQSTIPDHDAVHNTISPHGIYKYHQAGHQKHAWNIRTNPRVQAIFADIWGTTDLVTSFDGCCYIPKNCRKSDTIWTHTDQAPATHGLDCYQGLVALTSNKERTLVVYEGTHKAHQAYFESKGKGEDRTPWQKIDPKDVINMASRKRVLHIPAGAMALWDSRTFHQNQYGAPDSEERIVQYVCFLPRADPKNTKAMQAKRIAYYAERRTTSHWPYPIRVNGLQPQTHGDSSRLIDYQSLIPPDLDDLDHKIRQVL